MVNDVKSGLRVTLRLKMLVLLGGMLIAALVTYVALAVHLITEDRVAYAFDLDRRVATNLSVQVRASMESMAERLALFGSLAVRADDDTARAELARQLVRADPDILRLRLYRRDREGRLVGSTQVVVGERLRPLELPPADLGELDRIVPLPLGAAGREPLIVLNRSLPPTAQLLTVLVAEPTDEGAGPSWAVSADIGAGRLQQLFAGSSVYRAFLVDVDGIALTHPDAKRVIARQSLAAVPVVKAALARRQARSGALELDGETGGRVIGAWADVGVGRLTVVAETDREQALATTRHLVRLSWLFGAAVVLVAFLASIVFSRRLTTPLQRLRDATRELAQGRYEVSVDVHSRDEIGELAADFRKMAKDIQEGQRELVQAEKMAAFGQLGAGITHEVKNPLTAIRGFAQLALHGDGLSSATKEALQIIDRESERCVSILQNFLAFARHDPGKRSLVAVESVAARSVKLMSHQAKTSGITVHEDYGPTPPVTGSAGQLQQVLLNLLINALQALGTRGNVWVSSRTLNDGRAEVQVRDDGPGIPIDAQERIFEPFFTTKPAGTGTGLGLSVSRKIVRDHGGDLLVESSAGQGATFKLRLPPASPDERAVNEVA
jgi:signal transduction histidine kinase